MKKYETWKNFNFFFFFCFLNLQSFLLLAVEEIQTVPLINLEDLSPTFEEDKMNLEKIEEKNTNI